MNQTKEVAEEATRAASQATEKSIKASEEAINKAGDITESAKGITETSIKAAREALESSKQAAKEAAKAAISVFEDMIGNTEAGDKPSQQAVNQPANARLGTLSGGSGKIEETAAKASGEKTQALAATVGEAVNEAGIDIRRVRESKEIQQIIETRLESLARMYSSNKFKEAGEEDED